MPLETIPMTSRSLLQLQKKSRQKRKHQGKDCTKVTDLNVYA